MKSRPFSSEYFFNSKYQRTIRIDRPAAGAPRATSRAWPRARPLVGGGGAGGGRARARGDLYNNNSV